MCHDEIQRVYVLYSQYSKESPRKTQLYYVSIHHMNPFLFAVLALLLLVAGQVSSPVVVYIVLDANPEEQKPTPIVYRR